MTGAAADPQYGKACGGIDMDKLRGEVEIDECFVGGLEANKHESKKLRLGRGSVGKTAAVAGKRITYAEVIA